MGREETIRQIGRDVFAIHRKSAELGEDVISEIQFAGGSATVICSQDEDLRRFLVGSLAYYRKINFCYTKNSLERRWWPLRPGTFRWFLGYLSALARAVIFGSEGCGAMVVAYFDQNRHQIYWINPSSEYNIGDAPVGRFRGAQAGLYPISVVTNFKETVVGDKLMARWRRGKIVLEKIPHPDLDVQAVSEHRRRDLIP